MLEPKIEPDPETVTVVYELIREVPEQQVELASKLDTKMMGIFSVASIAISLGGFSATGVGIGQIGWLVLPLIAGLLAYVRTAYIALRQISPTAFHVLKYEELWEYHWDQSAPEFQHSIVTKVSELCRDNELRLQGKSEDLKKAIKATAFEVTFIAVTLILILVF